MTRIRAWMVVILLGWLGSAVFGQRMVVRPTPGPNEISRTVGLAKPGTTIVVLPGTYRGEHIVFDTSGTAKRPITLRGARPGEYGAKGGRVVITGGRMVSGWKPGAESKPIYRHEGWPHYFGQWDKRVTAALLQGQSSPLDARDRGRNQLFVDGEIYQEVPAHALLGPGRFFIDPRRDTVDLWLKDGSDPNQHRVELAATQKPLLTTQGQSHIRIEGLTFRYGANPPQGSALVQLAGGQHCEIVNCRVSYAAGAGLSVRGSDHEVRDSELISNGQLGLHATRADGSRVVGCLLADNNQHPAKRYDPGWEAGGIKVTWSSNFTIKYSLVRNNWGPGIWYDLACEDARIIGNVAHHNGVGIHYEISYAALIANNRCYENRLQGEPIDSPAGQGIYLSSSAGSLVYRNICYANATRGIEVGGSVRDDGKGRAVFSHSNALFQNMVVANQRQNPRATDLKIDYLSGLVPKPALDDVLLPIGPNIADHNLYYRSDDRPFFYLPEGGRARALSQWQNQTALDTHSTWANPRFRQPTHGDFRLGPTSPARDWMPLWFRHSN